MRRRPTAPTAHLSRLVLAASVTLAFQVALLLAPLAGGLMERLAPEIPVAARPGSSGDRRRRERGDVPGWVLVTLMTAGLVTILYALAREQLTALFTRAVNAVAGLP